MNKSMDVGLLLMRLGLGAAFVVHGYPKIVGGPERWAGLGQAMSVIGISFAPVFWGFMAALAEFAGGICLVLGLAFRISSAMLAFTMFVATALLFSMGKTFTEASHPLELIFVFVGLLFTGPGRLALARWVPSRWVQ